MGVPYILIGLGLALLGSALISTLGPIMLLFSGVGGYLLGKGIFLVHKEHESSK